MQEKHPFDEGAEVEDSDFKPLSAQEAQQWRMRHPATSVWSVVAGQAVLGVLVAVMAWWISGRASVGWSAAYGAVAVVVPAALVARGITRKAGAAVAGSLLVRLLGWELAKIALTVVLLLAAPSVVPQLSWLALLVGMVITMKMYWVALWMRPGVRKTD